ncbi:unnamed protein product [Ixodes pacificus]
MLLFSFSNASVKDAKFDIVCRKHALLRGYEKRRKTKKKNQITLESSFGSREGSGEAAGVRILKNVKTSSPLLSFSVGTHLPSIFVAVVEEVICLFRDINDNDTRQNHSQAKGCRKRTHLIKLRPWRQLVID